MDLERYCGEKRFFSAESVIFEEGDSPDFIYFVQSGKVALKKKVIVRTERLLHIVTTGEYFGEMGLMTGKKRTATAKAIEDTEVFLLGKSGFLNLFKEDPEFGLKMVNQMAGRLQKTSEELVYSELELALSTCKPDHFQFTIDEKVIFIVKLSFGAENKRSVLDVANSIEWADEVDVITSLYVPGKDGAIFFVLAANCLDILMSAMSRLEGLVEWEFLPAVPLQFS